MNEERFTGKAVGYAKYRPDYPKELIDYLYSGVGFGKAETIADIAAGTGKFTKHLLEKGSTVYAVEPNADMRGELYIVLSDFPSLKISDGTAENTKLETGSIDFVTAAQAYHWFDRELFRVECQRILKKSGKAVLIWNSRDEDSEFVKKSYEISRKFCPGFKGGSGGRLAADNKQFDGFFKDGNFKLVTFPNQKFLNEEGFVGGNLSSSYAPYEGEENYAPYVNALRDLFSRYARGEGKKYITMPFITQCYIGEVEDI